MVESSRQEWLQWRQKGIGSSDAPIIHEVSEWGTPLKLYEQKITTIYEEQTSNWAMEKGNELEPMARRLFAAQYNLLYGCEEKFEPKRLELVELPILQASLDGMSESGKDISEFKFQGKKEHIAVLDEKLPIKGGRVPLKYWIQCQHQLLVSGAERCHFVSYNPEIDKYSVNHVVITPDEEFFKEHIKICTKFWKHVIDRDPPELSIRDFKQIRSKDATALAKKYLDAKKRYNDADVEMKELKAQLAKFSDHPRMIIGPVKVCKRSRIGNVGWQKIPEVQKLTQDYIDGFRGKTTEYYEVEENKWEEQKTTTA
jgi:putative phage-type endonuclease